MVHVGLKTKGRPDRSLDLYTVPMICEPLSLQPILMCTEKYEHLSQLEMADPVDGTTAKEIDVLIGSDHYWDLVTGDI